MKMDRDIWGAKPYEGDPLVSHIAMLGNSPPRRCGLATYTRDSGDALGSLPGSPKVDYYAMDDGQITDYPQDIALIDQDDIAAYQAAADTINASGAQVLWVQHEYGIFGGEAGSHLLALINRVRIPIIVTLHTILEDPSDAQQLVLERLMDRAVRIVVMAQRGRDILTDRYRIDADKIDVVAHGAPDRPAEHPVAARVRLGLDDRPTILTFGLLAPDKGIEDAIEALAIVREQCPDVHYIIVGATHPHLLKDGTDTYRDALRDRAARLGLLDSISFVDRFVEIDELLDWLAAADIYVTPYRNAAQITSGTLSYAVALGKAIVSTPYAHATELLAEGHGELVPFRSPQLLADALARLVTDEPRRRALGERAYKRGRATIWRRNAEAMRRVLAEALSARGDKRAFILPVAARLAPIERMSDDTGMFQHSIFGVADRRHGYCIDDNARGLLLMSLAHDLPRAPRVRLANVYASFVQYAWNSDERRFRNFMGYNREWLETSGSDDSNGRTLWSLGIAARSAPSEGLRYWAAQLYNEASTALAPLMSPRARAFAMLGAVEMHAAHPLDLRSVATLREGGALLMSLLDRARRPDWPWFETVLSYDNTRLPEALIRAGRCLADDEMIATGLDTLDWIGNQTTGRIGQFQPVGTASFGVAYAEPALFDQQPLEAWATIDACVAAYAADPQQLWIDRATAAYRWFLGDNTLSTPVVDAETGECGDGLTPFELNKNNGAESVIAWQAAHRAYCTLIARHDVPAGILNDA